MYEKITIIVNPSSGNQQNSRKINRLCEILLDGGYTIRKFITKKKDDAYHEARSLKADNCDLIVACGGDGTINEVVNGVMDAQSNIPIAILSSGTVNDFASFLSIPTDVYDFYHMIRKGKLISCDVGYAEEKYFINVCAIGNIANVAHGTDINAKAIFGKLAYVAEGIKEMPSTLNEPITLTYKVDGEVQSVKAVLMLIANTSSVGGFNNICPKAQIDDGLLDVLIIKSPSLITDLGKIFIDIFLTNHLASQDVLYFQTDHIEISSDKPIPLDVDGEYLGILPKKICIADKKLNILIKE